MRKFGVVSLGCDKNRIDTENMIAYMIEGGYSVTADSSEAEVIIINTCGFIKSAIEESINTIFEMAEKKKEKCKYLVVTGCMSQRFMDELSIQIPEVDLFIGTMNYHKIAQLIDSLYANNGIKILKNDINDREFTSKRYLTTPPHYAYLKIAEGCSNRCTYCAIPSIRGRYTSRPFEEIIAEVKILKENTFLKELILIAQDVTKYGEDLYQQNRLIELIKTLDSFDIPWIRLLYCYPELVSEELIKTIVESKHILHYLDIPLQHISSTVLKRMNRRVNKEEIESLIKMIRKYDPNFIIRSTFIVGFPGETEEDFEELKSFLTEYKLDRVGFFMYSREEGTPAYKLPNQIDSKTKKRRYNEIYNLQRNILAEKQKQKIGFLYDVIYEGIDYDKEMFFGRNKENAPEIDAKVYFNSKMTLEVGNIYTVRITGYDDIDLLGEVVYEQD